MELQLDVIAVMLVFIGFCIGSAILIKKANEDMAKQKLENDKIIQNNKNGKNNKK